MGLSRETVKGFQSHVSGALGGLFTEYDGMPVKLRDGSRANYDPTTGEVKITLTFIVGDEDGFVCYFWYGEHEGRQAQWAQFSAAYGLAPEDLGRTFTSGGNAYKITGCNPGGRKRPILAERESNGKQYVFPVEFVTRQLRPWNVGNGDVGGIFWYDADADALRQASHAG